MLSEMFYWAFNMSLIGSCMGLLILLLRTVKAVPRRIVTMLWAIPFLRFSLPLWPNNPYSLMALISRFTTRTVTVLHPTDEISLSVTNSIMAANSYFPITYRVDLLDIVFRVASVVWAIGAAALLLALAMVYLTTLREIRDATHMRENIYLSPHSPSDLSYFSSGPSELA